MQEPPAPARPALGTVDRIEPWRNGRDLRILMVTPRCFPFMGGIETHVHEVAPRLAHAGVDVTVLASDPGGHSPACEERDGVHIRRVRSWPDRDDIYLAPGLWPIIERGGWDLVHCQGYHTLVPLLAMFATRRAAIPYVLSFHSGGHSSRLRTSLRAAQQLTLRPLLAGAERLIAVSRFEAELFQRRLRLPRERFVVIPNGATLPQPGTTSGPDPARPLIASVGRLERYKGHHRVIAALPGLLPLYPDVRLRVVGGGPYEAELRRLAESLGIADRVEIGPIPPTDRQAMATLLVEASLVTLLSDYEAHPIAALEALALGRPVLVTRTSGLGELADRGLAKAIALGSPPAIVSAAIIDQLQAPLVPTQVELPTWDDCATELLKLYRTVAQEASTAKQSPAKHSQL
jgi:glycogen synthase